MERGLGRLRRRERKERRVAVEEEMETPRARLRNFLKVSKSEAARPRSLTGLDYVQIWKFWRSSWDCPIRILLLIGFSLVAG